MEIIYLMLFLISSGIKGEPGDTGEKGAKGDASAPAKTGSIIIYLMYYSLIVLIAAKIVDYLRIS